jgi:hypothetical protein
MKSHRFGIAVIVILFVIIVIGFWYLIASPAYAPSVVTAPIANSTSDIGSATSTPIATSSIPTASRVIISSPLPNATVAKTFTVSGSTPNNWYFEASFPIEVRDIKGKLITQSHAQAQSDWTVEGPVAFTASITIPNNYSGPANLMLMRDNPSGLPQNNAEMIIPITID